MRFRFRDSCFLLSLALMAEVSATPAQSASESANEGTSESDWGYWAIPDESCSADQAWTGQQNPQSDATGLRNVAYPEGNATYWAMLINADIGSEVTIHGQFPGARYMGLQVYDTERNVRGAINDRSIVPDAGQNNPFVVGSSAELGTYTVRLVFGDTPETAEPNTIYSDGLVEVGLVYRVYHSNDPTDLTGGTTQPSLPTITANGVELVTCAPRPILPESATVNGHIDQYDFTGTEPEGQSVPVSDPPGVLLSITNPLTPYYPSADNNYISTRISREFLAPPYDHQLVVMRMRAPTFANTQAGEAPYLAEQKRQVRFWSVCGNEPLTTGVVRCLPDNEARLLDGFVTVVFSDPSNQPEDSTLEKWGANWLPWGALTAGDVVYDIDANPLTNEDGVFYYGMILYRQTMANPKWRQSMANVGELPRRRWEAAMGHYWPTVGYCSAADFEALGAGCIAP